MASLSIRIADRPALRIREAVAFSGLSRGTLYRLIGIGRLKTSKIGRIRLVLRESLEQVLIGQDDAQ